MEYETDYIAANVRATADRHYSSHDQAALGSCGSFHVDGMINAQQAIELIKSVPGSELECSIQFLLCIPQSMDPKSSPPTPAAHTMIIAPIAAREQFTAGFGRLSHHRDSDTKTDRPQSQTEGDGRTNNRFGARMCGGGSER
jgi:hypothetical protein